MSLNTLLEAAKFLELQEQNQSGVTTTTGGSSSSSPAASATAAATPIGTVSLVNENGTPMIQNGTSGGTTTQTFTLQPVKVLNTSTVPITLQNVQQSNATQALPPSTVVIANNNLSPAFLQGAVSLCSATSLSSAHQNNGINDEKNQNGNTILSQSNQPQRTTRIYNNSFDIMNPLIIDESNPAEQRKMKQPPMPFRNGNRDVHNKLEKHRRAHLKECFEVLKKQLPANGKEKKTSNLSILHSAVRYIESLKRKESELEQEMERLAREKMNNQQRLNALKKDISSVYDNVDFSKILTPETAPVTISNIPESSIGVYNAITNELIIPFSTTSSSTDSTTNSSSATPLTAVFDAANKIFIKPAIDPTSSSSSIECGNQSVTTSIPTLSIHTDLGAATIVDCSSTAVTTSASIVNSNSVINQSNSTAAAAAATIITGAGTANENKISIPILSKTLPIVTTQATPLTNIKEMTQPVQQTGISVVPMTTYPVNPGLVLQKVAIVPHKGLTELTPLVSTFYTAPQQLNGINGQLNGKVVPLTQYLVKPVVVVSTANPRPGS